MNISCKFDNSTCNTLGYREVTEKSLHTTCGGIYSCINYSIHQMLSGCYLVDTINSRLYSFTTFVVTKWGYKNRSFYVQKLEIYRYGYCVKSLFFFKKLVNIKSLLNSKVNMCIHQNGYQYLSFQKFPPITCLLGLCSSQEHNRFL